MTDELARGYVRSALAHRAGGSLVDAAADLQRALDLGDRCPDRARVLLEASRTQVLLGEWDVARGMAEEAMAAATAEADEHVVMLALGALGQLHRRSGDLPAALRIARDGRERAARLGDAPEQATFLSDESFVLELMGDLDGAVRAADGAVRIASGGRDPVGELRIRGRFGALLRKVGRFDEAYGAAIEGLDRARQLGEQQEEAAFLGDIADDVFRLGRTAEAAELYEVGLRILLDSAAWEQAMGLVLQMVDGRDGPDAVDVFWLAARAAALVGVHGGDGMRALAQQTAVTSMIVAIREGTREVAQVNLRTIHGLLMAARPTPDQPGPAAALDVATQLVVEWFEGRPVAPHADLIASVDLALGTTLGALIGT